MVIIVSRPMNAQRASPMTNITMMKAKMMRVSRMMVMMMSMTMTKVIMVTNKRAKSLSNHVAFLEFQLLELLKHLL